MDPVDHYAVLGVQCESSNLEIRAAYRALARQVHPDHGGSSAQMAILNAAWAVLGNARKRSLYDGERADRHARETILSASRGSLSGREIETWSRPIHRRSMRLENAPSARVLDFGRYVGWPLSRIAQVDRDYLEWLAGAPAGQRIRTEIEAALRGGKNVNPSSATWRDGTLLRR